MAGAIACGIAACIVTLTVDHAMGRNPIWWKNNGRYALTMDSWDPRRPYDPGRPSVAPSQLTDLDATYLYDSDIPRRKALLIGNGLTLRYAVPRLNIAYLAAGIVVLIAIGELAAWQPARRAARIAPSVATRTI